jgi:hypothetical protein
LEPGELLGSQDPSAEAVCGIGTPILETVLVTDMTTAVGATASLAMSEVATGEPAASIGLTDDAPSSPPQVAAATASTGDDDNTIEEPEVIMLDLDLRMLGKVSLSKAMGTTHFVLNEVHDMLHREREDLEEERLHLGEWGSLQKEWTTSEKEKMVVKQKFLDVMEVLLNKKQTAIDELDAKSQKLLDDIKELYTAAEAHANATSSSSRTSTHKRSPLPNGSRRWQTGC